MDLLFAMEAIDLILAYSSAPKGRYSLLLIMNRSSKPIEPTEPPPRKEHLFLSTGQNQAVGQTGLAHTIRPHVRIIAKKTERKVPG